MTNCVRIYNRERRKNWVNFSRIINIQIQMIGSMAMLLLGAHAPGGLATHARSAH